MKLICEQSAFVNRQEEKFIKYYCKSRRCKNPECNKKRAQSTIKLISDLCNEYKLDKFFTLTLGKEISVEDAWKNISKIWDKFLKRLRRAKGEGFKFVAILEKHKENDRPHIHGFWNKYVNQAWISQNWNECGGGKVVWIEKVEGKSVYDYVGKQMTVHKYIGKQNISIGDWLGPSKRAFWRTKGMKSKWELRQKDQNWELLPGIIFNKNGKLLILSENDLIIKMAERII